MNTVKMLVADMNVGDQFAFTKIINDDTDIYELLEKTDKHVYIKNLFTGLSYCWNMDTAMSEITYRLE